MTSNPLPRPTEPVNADSGIALSDLLGDLGFVTASEVRPSHGTLVIADAGEPTEGIVRVLAWPDDGGRVEVIAFEASGGSWIGPVLWRVAFDGNAPLDCLAALLVVALGLADDRFNVPERAQR